MVPPSEELGSPSRAGPCVFTVCRYRGHIQNKCRLFSKDGHQCAICKLVIDQFKHDLLHGKRFCVQLAQYYHTRDARVCVFHFVDRCWEEGKYIITRSNLTTEIRHEAIFRHVYFRCCDGTYRNALEEIIQSSDGMKSEIMRYTRYDGMLYYNFFMAEFMFGSFQHALVATAPCGNSSCEISVIPSNNLDHQEEVAESDDGLAALIGRWETEHSEATVRNTLAWEVYLCRLKRDLARHKICNLDVGKVHNTFDYDRIVALQEAVKQRSDTPAITRKTQLLMRVQFADLEVEAGSAKGDAFRISDLHYTTAELNMAKAYFDNMAREASKIYSKETRHNEVLFSAYMQQAEIKSGHLMTCASLLGIFFCSNSCRKWQQEKRLASARKAKEEKKRQVQARQAATTPAATTQVVSVGGITQSGRRLVGAAEIDQITEAFQQLRLGAPKKAPGLAVTADLPDAYDPAVEMPPAEPDESNDLPSQHRVDTSIRMVSELAAGISKITVDDNNDCNSFCTAHESLEATSMLEDELDDDCESFYTALDSSAATPSFIHGLYNEVGRCRRRRRSELSDTEEIFVQASSSKARLYHKKPPRPVLWDQRYDEDDEVSIPAYAVTSGIIGAVEQPIDDRGLDEDDYLGYVDYGDSDEDGTDAEGDEGRNYGDPVELGRGYEDW